jgi:hypothetical protein
VSIEAAVAIETSLQDSKTIEEGKIVPVIQDRIIQLQRH